VTANKVWQQEAKQNSCLVQQTEPQATLFNLMLA